MQRALHENKEILRMDKKTIEIAKLYTQKVRSYMPVSMVILYGSHARGTAGKNSDIDIAVVVDKFHGDYLKTSSELFNLVRTINKRIEPVLLCRENDKSGFLENVLKHGKIIYNSKN
jgi:predicted nucleotidyltransferase